MYACKAEPGRAMWAGRLPHGEACGRSLVLRCGAGAARLWREAGAFASAFVFAPFRLDGLGREWSLFDVGV